MTIKQQQGSIMPFMKSKRGFALSIVLWIVAALLLGIAFILNLSKDSLTLTKGVQEKLIARLQAQDYLEVIKYYVMTADFNNYKLINNHSIATYKLPKEIILDGRDYNISKNVTLSMRDASSIVNLFYPNQRIIAALASQGDDALNYTIKDSIKDWIDADSKVSLNGAESSYYNKEQNVFYKPRNYPALQSSDELRLIRGINTLNKKDFDRLSSYIYVSQQGAIVNLALVSPEYLSILLHIDKEIAEQLINYKYKNFTKFVNTIRKNHYYNDSMGFGLSFDILIKLKIKVGASRVILETFIDFRKNQFRDTTINMYKIY